MRRSSTFVDSTTGVLAFTLLEPSTQTSPAPIAAFALSRETTSPFATNQASRRVAPILSSFEGEEAGAEVPRMLE